MPIAANIATHLAHQTKLVRQWAAQKHEPRYDRRKWSLLDSFQKRLTQAIEAGLFIEEDYLHPARAGILEMQGRIAYCVHDLTYVLDHEGARAGGRWQVVAPVEERGANSEHRKPTYLDPYMDRVQPPRMSIPKVDVALIAHCFKTPVEIWELQEDSQYRLWVEQTVAGGDLFSFGGLAINTNDLKIKDLGPPPRKAPQEAGGRAVGGVVYSPPPPAHPHIPAGHRLQFSMDLPESFKVAQVMLFEDDGRDVTLVSTNSETTDSLRYEGQFISPRSEELGVWFDPSKRSELLPLIVAADAPLILERLPFFKDADPQQPPPVLSAVDMADLRRQLFALPREQWCMLRKVVSFV